MKDEDVKILIDIRTNLINNFQRCRDYKQNENAIMKEVEHAKILHETIVKIDNILKKYVGFSEK